MDNNHTEAALAGAVSSASVLRNALISEAARAAGVYHAKCLRVRGGHEADFVSHMQRHEDALEAGDYATAARLAAEIAEMQFLAWEDDAHNLVVNVGLADALDKYLSGSAYTASFFLGLVDGGSAPTYNAADTMASHAGWTESTAYSNATRVAPSFNAATGTGGGAGTKGTGSKATTATSFSINATATIAGCFLTTNSTKGGTTGTLYSAGSFTGGNRSVVNLDTLQVTYTATL